MVRKLTAKQVRPPCNQSLFECSSTMKMVPKEGIIGQDRALSALRFGLHIDKPGFNIFVAGPAGTGKTTVIKHYLETLAMTRPVPPDWVYVNNFKDPYRPLAVKLPAGRGKELQKEMEKAVEAARKNLLHAFTSKEYAERRSSITENLRHKREASFNAMSKRAREKGLLLQGTQFGLILLPAIEDKPMTEEEYHKLSEKQQQEITKNREALMKQMQAELASLQSEEGELEKQLQETDKEVAGYAIGYIFDSLRVKFGELPEVLKHLDAVKQDMVDNYERFRSEPKETEPNPMFMVQGLIQKQLLRNYEVNVVVDNSETKGAPAILELNPTFTNLLGRIEKEAQFGALSTDFTMIKGGSMHKANGGYLVLRIEDLLTNVGSWDGLKRVLRDGNIAIEDITERMGFFATKSLRPEPIPLDLKIIVVGEPVFYYLLLQADLAFRELFKVKADFSTEMDCNDGNIVSYAGVICRLCREEKLKHLASPAVAKILEHSSRMAGDQGKLSTLFADIADILREADFWAQKEESELIEARHVREAIEQKVYRSNLLQERINEMITEGTIIIDIEGSKIGQVNGLSVMDMGDFAFGRPSRITVSLGVGREGLVDIEREAKLGGPTHTKGALILTGYMTDKYANDLPISLSARIAFEQSYGGIDGDSASSTELYALLSRIAETPIKQGIAITGSVNQKGEVQAIGGVNEKIEGYYEICKTKGLDGNKGVMIPASNVRHLMLKEEVVEAVKAGKFHVWVVSSIDEGIAFLTGVKAGKVLKDGTFEKGTINDRVQKRLNSLAEKLRKFGKEETVKSTAKNGHEVAPTPAKK